jgi:hypothetical protein
MYAHAARRRTGVCVSVLDACVRFLADPFCCRDGPAAVTLQPRHRTRSASSSGGGLGSRTRWLSRESLIDRAVSTCRSFVACVWRRRECTRPGCRDRRPRGESSHLVSACVVTSDWLSGDSLTDIELCPAGGWWSCDGWWWCVRVRARSELQNSGSRREKLKPGPGSLAIFLLCVAARETNHTTNDVGETEKAPLATPISLRVRLP